MDEWGFGDDLEALGQQLQQRSPLPPLPPLVRRRPRPPVAWIGLAVGAGLALAVVIAGAWRVHRDAVALAAVSVVPEGQGRVTHAGASTTIEWREGLVEVDVQPEQGALVRVSTPEAEVRVVGTRFGVLRDARGTEIAVERGTVEVRCVHPPAHTVRLGAGEARWCLRSAGGALGLALSRLEDGAEDALVLEAIEAGLVHPSGEAQTRVLLRGLAVQVLARMDRVDEALEIAETLIGTGERDALATAVRLTLPRGCAAARPFLDALDAMGDEPARRLLERCAGG